MYNHHKLCTDYITFSLSYVQGSKTTDPSTNCVFTLYTMSTALSFDLSFMIMKKLFLSIL